MRIKPSSANNKKLLIVDKQVPPKKPTIVKCFICNQMFYSQDTFDSHMDQHQKKINKNFPDQIQRKTAQSFGLKRKQSMTKKSTNLQAIHQDNLKDKKFLNKTMKTPLNVVDPIQNIYITKYGQTKSSMLKKPFGNSQQFEATRQEKKQKSQGSSKLQKGADKQIAQIEEAIKQSTLLMSQMNSITERYEHSDTIFMTEQVHSDHQQEADDQEVQKTVSEHQFIRNIISNNWSLSQIQQQILKVNFSLNQSLENCQIQINYLKDIAKYSSNSKSLESITKTKSKILAQVISIIMSEQSLKQPIKHSQNTSQQISARQEENSQPRTCSQCLDMIGFGEICTLQGSQSFHKECFLQKNKTSY